MKKIIILLLVITCSARLFAQNYFWIGGSGNWSDLNHWALTSGGGAHPSQVPTTSDNIFIDGNSGLTASSRTITVNVSATCNNINFSGSGSSPIFTGAGPLNIYGSSVLRSGMTYTAVTNYVSLTAQTLTSNGVFMNSTINFNGAGSWSLADSASFGLLRLTLGTFNTANFPFTVTSFDDLAGGAKTINLGSSTAYVNSNLQFATNETNTILNAGTSVIKFLQANTSTGGLSSKSGDTYYDIIFQQDAIIIAHTGTTNFHYVEMKGNSNISGNNTYAGLTLGANKNCVLQNGTTQTVTESFTATAMPCAGFVTLRSASNGQQASISCPPTASVSLSNLVATDINATGGATFNTTESIDNGNNTGIVFSAPPTSVDLYWVGGSGNWDDKNHWSATSGGAGGACVPCPLDNVFFNAGSGLTSVSKTITLASDGYCRNITVSGAPMHPFSPAPPALTFMVLPCFKPG